MSIEDLKSILQPPVDPVDAHNIDWEGLEKKHSILLPDDFKELISTYGTGEIDRFVWVLNPASMNSNINLDKAKYFLSSYKAMKEEFPGNYLRPVYPAKNSFFPWAVTDNGETFVWIVDGAPNKWPVGIHSVDQGEEEVFHLGAVEFLTRLLRKEIKSRILPSQFPSNSPSFSIS